MWSIIGVFSTLFVLGVVGAIVVQTDWFHRWAARELTAVLSDELEAHLEFSSIDFNIFKGLELDSVRLTTRGDTVLSAQRLRLHYELEPLLIRRVVISGVELDDPVIRILRSRSDSAWNVEHIVKPTPENPDKKPFDWGIAVRNIALHNATVVVHDSLASEPIANRMHYTRLQLDSLSMNCSAFLNLARKQYEVSIDDFKAVEPRLALRISQLRCAAAVDTTSVHLYNLHFETPNTILHLYAELDSTNVFDSTTVLTTRTIDAHIADSHLLGSDLNYFMPPDFSLASSFDLATHLTGNLNALHFDIQRLRTQNTDLHGSYTMRNVANDKPFIYEVQLDRSRANYSDIRNALPSLKLGPMDMLEHLGLRSVSVYGIKDSIAAQLDVQGDFGQLSGNAALRTSGLLRYAAELQVQGLNASALTKDEKQTSSINGSLSVYGQGTTLEELNTQLIAQLGASSYAGHEIESLYCDASMADKTLTLDSLRVRFPWSRRDSINGINNDDPRLLSVHAQVDMHNTAMPVYSINTHSEQIPLAALVGDNNLPQAFGADIAIEGRGVHPDSLEATLKAKVRDFIMTDGALFPFALNATLQRSDAQHRHLTLHSDFADADVSGRYRLGAAWNVFLVHIGMLDRYVRMRYANVQRDSNSVTDMPPYTLPPDTLDLRYHVQLRGMSVLAPFIKGVRIDAEGNLDGSIAGTPQQYHFDLDSARVHRFSLRMPQASLLSQPILASLRVQTEQLCTQPMLAQADLHVQCDSVFRVNATRFVKPRFDMSIHNDDAAFVCSARMENHIPLYARGTMHDYPSRYDLHLDSLSAGWSKSLCFSSMRPALIQMSPNGVHIEDLALRYIGGNDNLSLHGDFNSSGFQDLHLTLRQLNLQTLKNIKEMGGIDALQMADGIIDSMGFVFDGLYRAPHILTNGQVAQLRYNDVPVGVQSLQARYNGSNLEALSSVTAQIGDSVKTLIVRVNSMPLHLSLAPFEAGLRDKEKVDISIQAADLSLAAVSPFIPGITNLNGKGDAHMTIHGTTPDAIDYDGLVTFSNASFLVPATRIHYTASGGLSLHNTTVSLDSIHINNVESDLPGGSALVLGSMRIRGFSILDLDINAEITKANRFLVMSNATAAAQEFMYGRTLISTQDNDARRTQRSLHFYGSPSRPYLGGFVMIEDADITFPPTINRTTRNSTFTYTRMGAGYSNEKLHVQETIVDTALGDLPPEEPVYKRSEQKLTKSFTDILQTDVNCKIAKTISVTMDFGLNDQMVAIVKQDRPSEFMRFIRLGSDSTSLKSDLKVDPATTYKFYSTFNASGTMNIDGPIDDPRLNLVATTGTQTRVINDRHGTYQVALTITGTKKKPKIVMDYWIDGRKNDGAVSPDEITTNALLLTMFGYTQAELSGNTSHVGGTVGGNALSGGVGAVLSKVLQGQYIKNVNVNFNGGVTDLSQAAVSITASAAGTNFTIGGTVADPTISVEFPLTESGNYVVSYMHATTPGNANTRQQIIWEAKIGGRIP